VAGQVEAKWACEVAAAGRHHMLFHGPPGVGKTMLAERVPGLLPDLDLRDSLEVSAVHSLAGFNLADQLITRPPYSDPHHSASVASIVGGGQRIARPGAISCAHKGVLFLDDSTEPQSTHPHLEISGGRVSVPGLATPPEGTSNRAPMIEAVWSKIHSSAAEVASCCW
jgi:predicted ATPase with chaperone activity